MFLKQPEITLQYLLLCDLYSIYWLELLHDICALNDSLKNSSEENLLKVLLYGAEDFTFQMNSEFLKCTIIFFKNTDCFSGPPFLSYFFFSLTKYLVLNIFLCVFYVFNVQFIYRIYSKRGNLVYLLLFLIYL